MQLQDPPMNKADLRRVYLQKRREMSAQTAEIMNHRLMEQVEQLDLSSIRTAHIFLTITKFSEPDTLGMAAKISEKYPQIRWVISKTERKTTGLYHFVWDSRTLIEQNSWGIPEPLGGLRIDEKEIDLVFVPLLVFDEAGYRVGYGKGYYDRFLAKCRPDVQKIGLSFFEPISQISDRDAYDIPLTAGITPTQTYYF